MFANLTSKFLLQAHACKYPVYHPVLCPDYQWNQLKLNIEIFFQISINGTGMTFTLYTRDFLIQAVHLGHSKPLLTPDINGSKDILSVFQVQ